MLNVPPQAPKRDVKSGMHGYIFKENGFRDGSNLQLFRGLGRFA